MIGCVSVKHRKSENKDISGIYKRQKSTQKLELKSDGTYTLFNIEQTFTPVFEQCEVASTGKWSALSNDLLEVISEDNYLKQKGFEYELKKENKFSQDSLYFQVYFSPGFHSVNLNFTFNNNNSKSLKTEKVNIVILKSKHLWDKKINTNQINFSIEAATLGSTLYRSRVLFSIFEEYVDTEKYNYLTITLPNFDRCFFEFEPLNNELIMIKSKNYLFWQGDLWKK